MAANIELKIFTPEKVAFNKKIHWVVLPYGRVNLTIIENRAPTSLLLEQGVLKILDDNNKVTDEYFIDGGVVDVAQNVCKISTLHLIRATDISEQQAIELQEQEPQNCAFYQMIAQAKRQGL